MRVLLDENLPRKLPGLLIGHECRTVVECGWSGKKNGELLAQADPLFDLLLTLDREIGVVHPLTPIFSSPDPNSRSYDHS